MYISYVYIYMYIYILYIYIYIFIQHKGWNSFKLEESKL